MSNFFNAPPYPGGCLCGQVRFVATEAPIGARICHCRLCQKAQGAAFLAAGSFAKSAVSIQGRTARYQSSYRLFRHFCPDCGSSLFIEPIDAPERLAVHLATLDDPGAIRPQMHIWTSSRLDWIKFDDGLPQYPEGSPVPFAPVG
ncbi:MAG TPA: GFA family protein [Caulobacteraceae bacterium]|nr:GFA family protein [Caulobacteraceae bacterium]